MSLHISDPHLIDSRDCKYAKLKVKSQIEQENETSAKKTRKRKEIFCENICKNM